MKHFTKIGYGIIAMMIFIFLKFWYSEANNEDVLFLLKPINKLVNIVTGSNSIFQAEVGYINGNLNIIINKICSGFNFMLIGFLMLSFLMMKYISSGKMQLFILPLALMVSYGFTIIVNASRILFSVLINRFSAGKSSFLHQFEGTFVYLSFLMLLYLSVDYFLKNCKYEKFA